MRAGQLRHRVTIQQDTAASDGQGGRTVTSGTLVANLPAQVEPLSGRELLQAQAIGSQVSYRVRLRFREDITPRMRVVLPSTFGGATLQIHAVRIEDGQRQALVLDCGVRQ
jgi:SPP1 family predicted phage head-tail adaptor